MKNKKGCLRQLERMGVTHKFNIKMYSQILKNRDTKLILSQYILDINLLKQGFVIAKAIE